MFTSPYLKFKNWPIVIKLAVVFSATLSVVIVWVVLNSLSIYNQSSVDQIKQLIPKLLNQVSGQLDFYVEGLVYDSQIVLSSSYYNSLQKLTTGQEYRETGRMNLRDTISLHTILRQIGADSKYRVNQIIFYTPYGTAYVKYQDGGLWQPISYTNKSWAEKIDTRTFAPIIAGFIDDTFSEPSYGMSIVQPIRTLNGQGLAGLLQVIGSRQSIQAIMEGLNLESDSFAYIVDHHRRVVYSSVTGTSGGLLVDEADIDLDNPDFSDAYEYSDIITRDKQHYLLSYTTSQPYGWKVLTLIPLNHLNKGMDNVRQMIMIWVLTGILLSVMLSTGMAFGITKALRLLAVEIRNFENKQTPVAGIPARYDEIGRLALAFKRMTQRIRALMDDNITKETLRQEAVIQALYHQMNPHFLYNTLESIRMTLKLGTVDKAELAIVSLGHLLRNQTTNNPNLIPVSQEIELVQCLLDIQKLRFADRLEVTMDCDPAANDCLMPCFTLQPLVENAIKYGQSLHDNVIRIYIRMRLEDGMLVGAVIDEGEGMTADKLEEVIDNMMSDQGVTERRNVGLFNIHQRIRLLFQERGAFFVDSAEGAGTVASFTIPVVYQRDEGGQR